MESYKEVKRVEKGIFIDFKGDVHHIVAVGIRMEYASETTLSIGVSICSPEDEYNDETGVTMAYERALNNPPILTASNSKAINCAYIDAILKSEIDYIRLRPQKYIKDYWKKYEKYKEEINILIDAEDHIYKFEDAYNFFIEHPKEYTKWKRAVEHQLRKRGCPVS